MGEAKRRKSTVSSDAVLSEQQKEWFYLALRKVINAYEPNLTASCSASAQVGALVLNQLGVSSARAVAGSALWRVGRGDGDVVVHARECMPGSSGMYTSSMSQDKLNAMFHAWIMVGAGTSTFIVDGTTYSLREKAALLDKADGMQTQVDWCPDYLWVNAKQTLPLDKVIQSYDAGVFGYRQDQLIQAAVFKGELDELRDVAKDVVMLYRLYESGQADKASAVLAMNADGQIGSDENAHKKVRASNLEFRDIE